MTQETISQSLGILLDGLRPFLVSVINHTNPDDPWEEVYYSHLSEKQKQTWQQAESQLAAGENTTTLIDYNNLCSFVTGFMSHLEDELGKTEARNLKNSLYALKDIRNKCAHYQQLLPEEITLAASHLKLAARYLNMPGLNEEFERLDNGATASTPKPAAAKPVKSNSDALPSWFSVVMPHYDIRTGNLDESIFAANLNAVAMGTAEEVYRDASTFFRKTYVTAGLRDLARQVVLAMNGSETSNRVVSLQTGFGGGKTHTLISLYHIVKMGKMLAHQQYCADLLGNGLFPTFENAKIAVFTNNTTDVTQGRTTEEGEVIHTLWGELAYQLGGIDGYMRVKENDIQRTAPAASIIQPIFEQAGPSLILIDELADYCVKAAAKKVGASNLYSQTNSFIQTLTEVVSQIPRCVLIVTLPASVTEVASSQIGQDVLDSLNHRLVRIASSIKPVDEDEVFEVVRRRLFENVGNPEIIEEVAQAYYTCYRNHRTSLPESASKTEYMERIRKSYPFHPELIDMFRLRWGSEPKFQRTRGVLRLLASIVQDLWMRRSSLSGSQALIHTSNVQLENLDSIKGIITNIRGSQWEAVMQADVYGSSSNAYKIDDEDPSSSIGKYRQAEAIATTILMASVASTQDKGMSIQELKLCLLRPQSFNANDIDGALMKLESQAHYMYASSLGGQKSYWFQSKPNINILINQAKTNISPDEIDTEIIQRLRIAFNSSMDPKILVAPDSDVAEMKQLTMVVLDPIYATQKSPLRPQTQSFIRNMATKRGNSDRVYRNTMFYLAPSEMGMSELKGKVRDFLACKKIESEYQSRLERDQLMEVNRRKRDFEDQVVAALVKAYDFLMRYSAKNGVEVIELNEFQSSLQLQVKTIIDTLNAEEWLLYRIGANILKQNNLWPDENTPVKVNSIYDAFLRFDDKPMIKNVDTIADTVLKYVEQDLIKVATGTPGNWSKVFDGMPGFFDVTNDDYYIVDPSTKGPEPVQPAGPQTPPVGPTVTPPVNTPTGDTPKTNVIEFKTVKISGKVALENWSQLFASFVNPLRSNQIEIEVSFKAKSTALNPITDNSATYKSIKESASQLGMTFETEEK